MVSQTSKSTIVLPSVHEHMLGSGLRGGSRVGEGGGAGKRQGGWIKSGPSIINKLSSVVHASVLLLIMNFVITLST